MAKMILNWLFCIWLVSMSKMILNWLFCTWLISMSKMILDWLFCISHANLTLLEYSTQNLSGHPVHTTIGLRFLSWFFGMYLKKSTGLQTQSFSSLVLCDVTGNISLFCMCGLEDQEVFRGWSLVKKLAFPLPSTTLTSSSVFRRAKKRT